MRLVVDTNVAVAGLLWSGPPRRLLELALDDAAQLVSSPALLAELLQTLHYPKFAKRMAAFETAPTILAAHYNALVSVVTPQQVPRVIARDADDDQVLACAVAARAHLIVSGDKHLHSLGGKYQGIRIVTPAEAIRVVETM
ncbi:MAG: putative toxin-antitoxin system toxin component, PIN family [Desulfobulbus sp.]|nr:putative toxin-antitoxin system toxin component, PIN family [Desulfobulbus sp.]